MSRVPLAYRLAVATARALTPLCAHSASKLGRGMAGRRDAHAILEAWAVARRRPERPLVWFHAPSVGEGLQARAVMEALTRHRPDLQKVYTYFSPSAEGLGARFGADVAGYLPWDQREVMGRVLDALAPDLIVFTKTEVWPAMVREAGVRGVPVAIVAGTVPPGAGRLRWPARGLMRPTWAALSAGLACSDADGEGLVALGVAADRVRVTGDPGIDAAAARARAADPEAPYLAPFIADPRPTLVAGSTWPSDEALLIPALAAVKLQIPDVRVVLAPHEPSPDRVGGLLGSFMEAGWHPSTLAHVEADGTLGDVDAVIVERVGVLSELYTVGTAAYVGGGFHDAGLHSVLEPAAAGLPVLFGPRHGNARAAAALLDAEAAREVHDPADTAEVLVDWLRDPGRRAYAGGRASGYIQQHLGAAERTARALAALMTRPDLP